MSIANKKPILVTGSHRSGSTWAGRMIAYERSLAYIHEPFNPDNKSGICKAHFKYKFPYICEENESIYKKDLENCLRFKYHLLDDLKAKRSIINITRSIFNYSRFTKYRILKKRPLVKDPIAVFSAEWLAKRFNMDVVVLIRHPAAFAGSLKKVKWSHPFKHFLQQPLLMKYRLHEYRSEIEEFSKNEKSIVDQAILLWKLVHHTILYYQDNYPDWIFVKHEDLSERPIEEFRNLYNRLGLTFSKGVEDKIRDFSLGDVSNIYGARQRTIRNWRERLSGEFLEQYKRNSKANIRSWKKRLTGDEIKKIQRNTINIASKFYTKKDWEG